MTVKGFGNRMIYGFGGLSLAIAATVSQLPPQQAAQAQNANALTVRSDIQEANTETGIITAGAMCGSIIPPAISRLLRPRPNIFQKNVH